MRKTALVCIALILSFTVTGLVGCGEDSEGELEEGAGGPSISSIIPKNGAKDVPTTTSFLIIFNKAIVTPSAANLLFTPPVAGEVSYDADSCCLIFDPSTELGKFTDYSLKLQGVMDMEGNSMSPATFSYTTSVADITRPEIKVTMPEDGQKDLGHDTSIVVGFSEILNRAKLREGVNFAPQVDVDQDKWHLEWSTAGDEEVTISPPAGIEPFAVNKEYVLVLSKNSVVDLSGNSMITDLNLKFRTLKYPVERIGNLNLPHGTAEPVWMYIVGKTGRKWVIIWGGTQPKGAPSQNAPGGTITASADGEIVASSVETFASNADNKFTPTVTKGNGNRLTYSTVALNNNRKFRMVFASTSSYVTFDLRSSAGTIPKQYVHIGNDQKNPSRTPFIMSNE